MSARSATDLMPPHRSRLKRLWKWLVLFAGVLILFYGAVGYLGCANMFGAHPRWRGMNRGPADFGLRAEEVSFTSQDGVSLRAWWLPADDVHRGVVVIAHGIDHTRQVMLPRATFLVHNGYDVVDLDLRGHGESGGTVVSPGILEAKDILGAVGYIRSRGNNKPIAVLGVSYGAVASLLAAAQSSEIEAVISDGAFTSGRQVNEDISSHFLGDPKTNFWIRALCWVSVSPGASRATALTYYVRSGVYLGPDLLSVVPWASRVPAPVLIISGEQDWIVPTARAKQIFAAIRNRKKEFLAIPGAVHDTTYSVAPKLYENAVLNFLASSIQNARQSPGGVNH